MLKLFKKLKDNIQFTQTVILSFLLILWVEIFNLNISYLEIFITFFTVIILDFFIIKYKKWNWVFPYSWVNAWFWISFFLRSEDLIIYVIAWILAISSKYLFKTKKWEHFFNPSNFWVFITLILFPQYSWINTLNWWNYSWIISFKYLIWVFLVFALWFFISKKVKKDLKFNYIYTIILPFILLHSVLFFIIPFYENWSWYREFFSISFFIFTFFMLTDPKTIPKSNKSRIFYTLSIVLSFYILQFFINESYAILGSLFVNTLFLPKIWSLERKYIKKKSMQIFYFYLILLIFEILSISILVINFWQPDLLFDNVCDQLFCK